MITRNKITTNKISKTDFMYPLIFLYYEIMLRVYGNTSVLLNLIYPIVFAMSTGFLCSFFVNFFENKRREFISVLLLFISGACFTIQCLVYQSMQFYISFATIGSMAASVASGYNDQVWQTVLYSIPIIVTFMLPFVCCIVVRYKESRLLQFIYKVFKAAKLYTFVTIFRNRDDIGREIPYTEINPELIEKDEGFITSISKKANWQLLLISVFLFGVGAVWANAGAWSDRYSSNYQFHSAAESFGLCSAVQLDVYYFVFPNSTDSFSSAKEEASQPEESMNTEESLIPTPTPTIVYEKNEMELELDSISDKSSSKIKEINAYVKSLTPAAQNEYTGLFKGKNLILICAEAFSHAAIDKSLTPTLYRLAHNGFYFSNYYQPSWNGSTSTGEYSMLMGIAPLKDVRTMPATQGNNLYFTMGNQLQRLGYTGNAYHNGSYKYYSRHLTHENLGYNDWIAQGNGLEKLASAWPSDLEMFEGTVPTYIDKQPFSVYYMTVSGHFPYKADDEKTRQHLAKVQEKTDDKYDDKTQYYLAYQMELEYSMRYLVRQLEAKGIADDTVICITADHYPYGLEHSSTYGNKRDYLENLYGYKPKTDWEKDKNAWILWSGSLENEDKDMVCEVSEPTYSLDILPTLSNLFGVTYDSRLLIGRDVFSDTEPLVLWNNQSWVTKLGKYDAKKGVFYPEENTVVDEAYVEQIKEKVKNKLTFSGKVLDYDYYGVLFDE